jgi:tetratricopeptide (TPR) repeat protein
VEASPRGRLAVVAVAVLALVAAAYGLWRWRSGSGTVAGAERRAVAEPVPADLGVESGDIPRVDDLAALDPAVAAAIREAVAALERDLGSGARWGELGIVYNAHRYYALAERCYARAVELAPQTVDWPHLRGVLAEERGDAAAAISHYRAALAIQSDDRAARYRLGNVLLASNDLDGAEAVFRELVSTAPNEPWGLLGLGRVEQRRGAHQAAARSFEQALALDPGNEQTTHLLASAYRELGEGERARQLAEGARDGVRAKSPTDPIVDRVRRSLRSLQSVIATAKETARVGDVDQAEALYQSVLEVDPESYDALYGLALLEGRRKRFAEAQALLERALEIRPKSSEARLMLSISLASQNQIEAARDELRALLADDPEHMLARGMLQSLGG